MLSKPEKWPNKKYLENFLNGITKEIKMKQLRMPNKEIYDDNNGLFKH